MNLRGTLKKNPDLWIGLAVSLFGFCVYAATLGPSIGFIDAGELAAVAHTFGVAHPTGYPLFTMLAGVFSHLPLGGTVIWKLNLFSALTCAASLFFFYRAILSLLVASRSASELPAAGLARISAAAGVLILAFSRTFWTQAVAIEVYALHLLLVSLILCLFLKALAASVAPGRNWFLFAFVLGLGFTNHMTTLLLLPALIYLYFATYGNTRSAWGNAARSLPFFLLGLLPYLYLPLRAQTHPALNWGAIHDLPSLYAQISGKQYSAWMFSSLEPAARNLSLFANTVGSEFGYLALLPALAGTVALFRRNRRLFTFTTLLFVGCLVYSVNYDIADIASYFLLAYVAIAIVAAFGIQTLLAYAMASGRKGAYSVALVPVALCIALPFAIHMRIVRETGNFAVEDYTRMVLASTEPGALVLTTQWDFFVAGSYYLQYVEGERRDVTVVDRELLRRSWYLRYLSQRFPELTGPSQAEIDAFLVEVLKFEAKEPYDPQIIQGTFEAMIRSLIGRSLGVRPVYVTPEIEPAYVAGFQQIPTGLVMRLYIGEPPVVPLIDFSYRPFPKEGGYFDLIKEYYARAYANQGLYLGMQGELNGSAHFLRQALSVRPEFHQAGVWLMQVEAEQARIDSLTRGNGETP